MTPTASQAIKRRKRLSLVCDNCKRKKIKCDKALPCSQCQKANLVDSCRYQIGSEGISGKQNFSLPYVSSAKNPIAFDDKVNDRGRTKSKRRKNQPDDTSLSMAELSRLKNRLEQIESSMKRYSKSPDSRVRNFEPLNKVNSLSDTSPYVEGSSKNKSNNSTPLNNSTPRDRISSLSSSDDTRTNSLFSSESSSDTSKSTTSTEDPKKRSLNGLNLYDSPSDTINFYENYVPFCVTESRKMNFGPFSWAGLMKRDRGLQLLWDYCDNEMVADDKLKVLLSNSKETETTFHKKMLEGEGFEDTIPYRSIVSAKLENGIKASQLNQNTLQLGLTYYDGKIDRELGLIDKVRMVLPKKLVISELLKRYFTVLYSFMPFVDEEMFLSEITRIIGPLSTDDTKTKKIKAEKKLDLAYIGLLLIILRLSYLSLFSNKNSVNENILKIPNPCEKSKATKYLLLNPVNIDTIDIAQECLDQFQLLRKTSFPVLQLAFYMRMYHSYAPEDGDGVDGGDLPVFNALLVQMAYSLGLNREPLKYPEVCANPRINHLGRKIWFALVHYDLFNAYQYGNPMTIDRSYYDTKPPFYEDIAANVKDKTLDKGVTQTFNGCYRIIGIMSSILRMCLSVEARVPVADLCTLLTTLELELERLYGHLGESLKLPCENVTGMFEKSFRIKVYMSIKSFLSAIYFHFYLYYEENNILLSFFYLKKVISIGATDIMPYYFELLANDNSIFDMMINPTLEAVLHKCNQVHLSHIIRVNFIIYYMKNQPNHDSMCINDRNYCTYYKTLCNISSCLTRCAEVSIAAISKISNRYYYAWRITKIHTHHLKIITTREFYDKHFDVAKDLCVPRFSLEQLLEIINICEATLSKLGKVGSIANDFCPGCPEPESNVTKNTFDGNETDTTPFSATDTFKMQNNQMFRPSETPDIEKLPQQDPTNDFGLDFNTNAEIDQVWLDILSFKYDKMNDGEMFFDNVSTVDSSSNTDLAGPILSKEPKSNGFSSTVNNYDLFNNFR
ncbi:uncharacterized protein PRCAT00005312001 [Priceomyces carsonii]|uniref:uncharacterized protein n=1 Tax=Priceomyces carsonii TaxID=28549 RepID=UPI002ED8D806|nr:unnamed protein product [Priceomyces carsonii]